MTVYRVAIIGGGIVGLASAMALVRRGIHSLCVLEAEPALARHQTGNNSGVIHSGLYYRPGSLKAKNCVAGREALYRFCREQGIRHERCGKIVVAVREEEIPALLELERRGKANGLKGLRRLDAGGIREYEPHVRGRMGLFVPQTGIVDYVAVSQAYARIVRENGGEILTGTRLTGLERDGAELVLETSRGTYRARYLVNCAGLYSDRVARMCGVHPNVKIVPFRGEYFELLPEKSDLIRNLVYPVPDVRFPFLGVHFTRMIQGGVEAGPNAVLAFHRKGYTKTSFSFLDAVETFTYPGFWSLAGSYWKTGLMEMVRSYSKRLFVKAMQALVPEITVADVRRNGAGVRAQAVEKHGGLADDFRIVLAPNQVHVLNAPSPAATASISIGEFVADLTQKMMG